MIFRRMAQWATRSLLLALVVGSAFLAGTAGVIPADPTDDFSFSLSHPVSGPSGRAYRLISAHRVRTILTDRLKGMPEEDVSRLAQHLLNLSEHYRFDPTFVLALIQVESRFRPRAISEAGAVGLLQVMPSTAWLMTRGVLRMGHPSIRLARMTAEGGVAPSVDWEPGKEPAEPQEPNEMDELIEELLMDPFLNLSVGIAYLAHLRDKYQHLSPYYLLAAYNLGPAKMDELLSRKSFKPVKTKKYYEDIRRVVPEFRFYRRLPLAERAPRVPQKEAKKDV